MEDATPARWEVMPSALRATVRQEVQDIRNRRRTVHKTRQRAYKNPSAPKKAAYNQRGTIRRPNAERNLRETFCSQALLQWQAKARRHPTRQSNRIAASAAHVDYKTPTVLWL